MWSPAPDKQTTWTAGRDKPVPYAVGPTNPQDLELATIVGATARPGGRVVVARPDMPATQAARRDKPVPYAVGPDKSAGS